MPGMPDLPVTVDADVRQESGAKDTEPVYQTHRGKKPTSRKEGDVVPHVERASGWMRREESE